MLNHRISCIYGAWRFHEIVLISETFKHLTACLVVHESEKISPVMMFVSLKIASKTFNFASQQ